MFTCSQVPSTTARVLQLGPVEQILMGADMAPTDVVLLGGGAVGLVQRGGSCFMKVASAVISEHSRIHFFSLKIFDGTKHY